MSQASKGASGAWKYGQGKQNGPVDGKFSNSNSISASHTMPG